MLKLSFPIQATLCRQPDGSYTIATADYVAVAPDFMARFILDGYTNGGKNDD